MFANQRQIRANQPKTRTPTGPTSTSGNHAQSTISSDNHHHHNQNNHIYLGNVVQRLHNKVARNLTGSQPASVYRGAASSPSGAVSCSPSNRPSSSLGASSSSGSSSVATHTMTTSTGTPLASTTNDPSTSSSCCPSAASSRLQLQQQHGGRPSSVASSRASSCATPTLTAAGGGQHPAPNHQQQQCPICWKFMHEESQELVHLCNNCNKYICDDCASYSTNEQYWMCSSCRRRVTKQAVPADSLRDLGLESSDATLGIVSMQRRMTIRPNQALDAQLGVGKSCVQATALASGANQPPASAAQPSKQQQQQSTQVRPRSNNRASFCVPPTRGGGPDATAAVNSMGNPMDLAGQQQQSQSWQRKNPESGSLRRKSSQMVGSRADFIGTPNESEPKIMSQIQQDFAGITTSSNQAAGTQRAGAPVGELSKLASKAGVNRRASVAVASSGIKPQQQLARRPSTLTGGGQVMSRSQAARALTRKQSVVTFYAPGSVYAMASQQQAGGRCVVPGGMARRDSRVGAAPMQKPSEYQQKVLANQQQQQQQQMQAQMQAQMQMQMQQQYQHQQTGPPLTSSSAHGSRVNSRANSRASSQQSLRGARSSSGSGGELHGAGQDNTLMIPIPPDQIHLRRLSDQSNLVRRSSIIADTLDVLAMSRNRSHSNIDTHSMPFVSNYLYQQPQHPNDYYVTANNQPASGLYTSSNENLPQQQASQYNNCNGPHSDPQLIQNLVEVIHQQQQLQQQDQQHQPQLSSLITSYSQKQPTTAATTVDELHLAGELSIGGRASGSDPRDARGSADQSDSSSDIGDEDEHEMRVAQLMLDNQNEEQQPTDYFAAPRALSTDYMIQRQHHSGHDPSHSFYDSTIGSTHPDNNNNPINSMQYQQQQLPGVQSTPMGQLANQSMPMQGQIPSVSVSEFRSSQQRLQLHNNNNQQDHPKQQQFHHHPLHNDSMNTANSSNLVNQSSYQHHEHIMTTPMQINVAIEQAIELQRRRQSLIDNQNQFMLGASYLGDARRGSSGRALPRVPGSSEQSRSLLELSQQHHHTNGTNHPSIGLQSSSYGAQQQPNANGMIGDPDDPLHHRSGHGLDQLDLPGGSHVRRASAPEGQNIKIVVDDIEVNGCLQPRHHHGGLPFVANRTQPGADLYERLVLYRDDSLDPGANLAAAFGLKVMGGKICCPDEKLETIVTWVLPGGPADKVGIKPGDQIIEWDSKCLVNMSYEQVAEVIESSANFAELLIKPAAKLEPHPGVHYVRSSRRLSQQTERDTRRSNRRDSIDQTGQQTGLQNNWRPPANNSSPMYGQSPGSNCDQTVDRSGTGRRLPRLPGQHQPDHCYQAQVPSSMSASTSQLHQHSNQSSNISNRIMQANNNQQQQQHLAPMNSSGPAYQSRSTGQLEMFVPHQLHGSSYNGLTNMDGSASSYNDDYNQPHLTSNYHNQPTMLTPENLEYQRILAGSPNKEEILALVGLQVRLDTQANQLIVSVLSAVNINLDMSNDYYVRIGLLPETGQFKPFKSQPSGDLNWKETFIYQNFPCNHMHRMALEISLWPWFENQLTTQPAQPVCGTMISLQSGCEKNTDFWPLRASMNSVHLRRKSLNDLIENQNRLHQVAAHDSTMAYHQFNHQQNPPHLNNNTNNHYHNNQYDNNYNQHEQNNTAQFNQHQLQLQTNGARLTSHRSSLINQPLNWVGGPEQTNAPNPNSHLYQNDPMIRTTDQRQTSSQKSVVARERSASNRNIPSAQIVQQLMSGSRQSLSQQPRRASDEVARFVANRHSSNRISPNSERRSKSVMNVNNNPIHNNVYMTSPDHQQSGHAYSRRASQTIAIANAQQQQQPQTLTNDPHQQQIIMIEQVGSQAPKGVAMNPCYAMKTTSRQSSIDPRDQSASNSSSPSGATRRRPSIADQSRSQRNSEEPIERSVGSNVIECPPSQQQQSAPIKPQQQNNQCQTLQAEDFDKKLAASTTVATDSTNMSLMIVDGGRKRAASTVCIQRKDSLAKMTLRKLKRNMSFSKATSSTNPTSGATGESSKGSSTEADMRLVDRRSSSSSNISAADMHQEDKAVTRRIMARESQVGRLKLSLLVTKGHLELEIICGQDFRLLQDPTLGVFVKIYVKSAKMKSKSHKKKTRTVHGGSDSILFKQLIKYDASLVDNRVLEVSVWQKQGGLKAKLALGMTEIRLAGLDLARVQTSWYNLRPYETLTNSSIEE